METKALSKTDKNKKEIQLVKGIFTPSEASHVISSLIDEKINFHKIQRLEKWEGNHKCNNDELDDRISELQKEKQVAKEFIAIARNQSSNLKINSVLEISITTNTVENNKEI